MNNTLSVAEQWLELGIAVIPIRCGSKKPALRWRPYIERLPRGDELRAWWPSTNGSGYGIAVLPGWADLVIIDFDSSERHQVWLAGLSPALAQVASSTYKVLTRRGTHYYIYSDEETRCTPLLWDRCEKCDSVTPHRRVPDPSRKVVRCLDCQEKHDQVDPQGVDIKARGGYCLAPPTVHPSGHHYAGVGGLADIQRVESVYELLPEARRTHEAMEAPCYEYEEREENLWDLAMRDPISASIDEIKRHFSIAKLLNRPEGNGRRWVTLCPLHAETSPSFTVFTDGHYKCFGCNESGDVITLFAKLNRISNKEAIREMARMIAL